MVQSYIFFQIFSVVICIVSGIANSLNITDLLMPSLKEMPKSMVFTPYTDSQLQMILSKKMVIIRLSGNISK